MTTNKILVLDPISNKMQNISMKYLQDHTEIIFCENDSEVEKHIDSSDILVTFTNGISRKWIQEAVKCKLIQKLGAGVNNIAICEATKYNIPVANTVGLNATSVAEHTVALMSATLKHLVKAHNKLVGEGKWLKTGLRDNSYELSYKKVGLIGFGNIGRQVKRILRGYECKVFYYDLLRLTPEEEAELDITYMELDEIIEECDIVSLHVPLTDYTYHLINEEKLKKMKSNAILINTCRGGVIDEEALFNVLRSGHITGAGLDVFESEPLNQNHKLTTLENVILTPHIGGGTNEAMEAVIFKAFQNINSIFVNGEVADKNSVVNRNELNKVNL